MGMKATQVHLGGRSCHDRNETGWFWPVAAALALAWLATLALILHTTVPTDVGWYLISTRKWLAGAELYREIVEVNPPLAFYLTVPAVWTSDTGILGDQAAMFVYVAVLIAISLTWCCHLIYRSQLSQRQSALLSVAVFCGIFLIFYDDFAQREHFATIFSMPLVLMTALQTSRPLRWQERFAVALFALPGLALKPFFLAAPFLMTLARMAVERNFGERMKVFFSPENLTIGFGCVVYLSFVWVRHPAYFEVVIPLAQATYIGIEHEFARPMQLAALAILVIMPALLFLRGQSVPESDRPVVILFSAAAGFAAAYLVQAKGWYYHAVPAIACAIVASAWYAGARLAAKERSLVPAIVITALGYIGIVNPLVNGAYMHPETLNILARHADRLEGRKIAGWTPKIETSFPLVNMVHGEWALRYPHLWPLAGALYARSDPNPARRETGLRAIDDIRRNLVDDFVNQEPDIILLPIELGDNFLRLLGKDPRFEPAFGKFEKIDVVDEIEIWERRTAAIANTR